MIVEFVVAYAFPLLLAALFLLVVGSALWVIANLDEVPDKEDVKVISGAYADEVQERLGITGTGD